MMLVDGARVIESIVDGNRDFVGTGNLKTVEIIRGPAGVLYGADALGGLVAFVTKDPDDYLKGRNFGGQVDTGYNSYDKGWSKSGTTAFRWGEWSALISASQRSYSEGTLSNADPRGRHLAMPAQPGSDPLQRTQSTGRQGLRHPRQDRLESECRARDSSSSPSTHKSDKTTDQRHDLGLQAGNIRT